MQPQPPPLPSANPYAAPTAQVFDVVEGDQVLADRGIRLLAVIVDGLIIAAPIIVVAVIFGAMAGANGGKPGNAFFGLFGFLIFVVLVGMLIVNMVLLYRNGQTMAKRMFSIKIVRSDGSRCSLPRIIFARWLPVAVIGAVPLIGPIVSLVDPLLIFRDDFRCLHDLIADTIVIKA